jgi:hypothetical protein
MKCIPIKWKLFLLAVIQFITATELFCQNKDGQELTITDSISLQQHHYKAYLQEQQKNVPELARASKQLADYYFKQNKNDSQLYYYRKALRLYEQVNDSFYIAYCKKQIGGELVYSGGSEQTMLEWILPAAKTFERMGEFKMAAHTYHDISNFYRKTRNEQQHKKYFTLSIELNKKANDTLLHIIHLTIQAGDARNHSDYKCALDYTTKALELSRLHKKPLFEKVNLQQLGEIMMHEKQYQQAIETLNESLRIHVPTVDPVSVTEPYRIIALCYVRLGKADEAEQYLLQYSNVLDSFHRKQQQENYNEMLLKYEAEKKQSTINSLEQENKLKVLQSSGQKKLIIALVSLLAVLLTAAWLLFRNINHKRTLQEQLFEQQQTFNLQLQKEKEEKLTAEFNKQLAEVQVTALSAQMNPHFIFNCMNSIQKYVLKNEKAKALEFLQNFSDLMRNVLDNSSRIKVALDEEINMLTKYIQLEQQRLDYSFDYQITVAEDMQTDFFEIPSMIIQPYVENAIWHGLMNIQYDSENPQRKGLLTLQFERTTNTLCCKIKDNGVGRKKASLIEQQKSPSHKSYGMSLAQKRLDLLKKSNEQTPEITVTDNEPVGTTVTIFIPLD